MAEYPADQARVSGRPASLLVHLLRRVTWPHWIEQRLRTVLTVVGVSLGVATVVGVSDLSASILASFRQMIEAVAGANELEVTSAAGNVDEDMIERAAEVRGVKAAAGVVESFLTLADRPDETVYLLGVDFLGSPVWEAQIPRATLDVPDEIAFLAQPDSIVLTREFAAREGLSEGDAIELVAPDGRRALRVRGLLGDAPPARLFDGAIALMDLPAAQRLLGREGWVDRVAIQLAPGERVAEVRERLTTALGPAVEVAEPEARGQHSERLLFSLRAMLISASSMAVIVGALIVFQTVAVSVQQRRRTFAMLNTVGIERGVLVRLCLLETLVLAVAGLILGFAGGKLLAASAVSVVGGAASDIWMRLGVAEYTGSAAGMTGATAVGVGIPIAAAYLAMRATFRAPTVEAMRPVILASEEPGSIWRPMVVAVTLLVLSWGIGLAPVGLEFQAVVAIIIVSWGVAHCGSAILATPLVRGVGAAARLWGHRSPWLPLRLAAENLPRNPGRGGMTVATITAALAMAVALAVVVHSFEGATLGWIEQHFGGDIFVGSGKRFRLLAGPPMSKSVWKALVEIPGVAAVEPFRVIKIRVGDRSIFLQSISLQDRLERGGLPMIEGSLSAAAPGLAAGTGVLLSDNLAYGLQLHRGDRITLPMPLGASEFRVEGTFIDYLGSLDLGAVGVAHEQLASLWGDSYSNLFRVWLEAGTSSSSVRAAILERLGPGYYAITTGEFLGAVRSVLDRFFLSSWALAFVASFVGVIGIVNAQLATVLDRSAEITMTRTIGVSGRDVTRAVLLECGTLGMLGGAAGVGLGTMQASQFGSIGLPLVNGLRMPLALPLLVLPASVAFAALISALAGYVPARVAARLELRQRSID